MRNRLKAALTVKERIRELVSAAAALAHEKGRLPSAEFPEVHVEEPKVDAHGDFSTNFAMLMAATQKMAPRKIAEAIVAHLNASQRLMERVDIAGPGFINFYLKPGAWHPVLQDVHAADRRYGATDLGRGDRGEEGRGR